MARRAQDNPQLDMTPMIDVVFELIIFFVVTIKQEDIFSKLNANRPAPNTKQEQQEANDTQIKIDIGPGGFIDITAATPKVIFAGTLTVMVDDMTNLMALIKKIKTVRGVKQVNR